MHAVDGSSSVMYSMFRNRSISTKTIGIAASHDGTTAPSEQRLEVNVFPLAGTSATVVVLSGEGMQVNGVARACAPIIILEMRFIAFHPFHSPLLMPIDPDFLVFTTATSLLYLHLDVDACCTDDCGPMGIICTSAEPKDGHHPSRFSVSATFQMTPKPVLLTPFHSAACDLSTPPWVWAVLGTCLFLFFGTSVTVCRD
jgi:hypothetical protein